MPKPKAINRKKVVAFFAHYQKEDAAHERRIGKAETQTVVKHKEKRLQSELKRLTRSERTHRLCTRAGRLEIYLKEPTVLADEEGMELLIYILQSEAAQKERWIINSEADSAE